MDALSRLERTDKWFLGDGKGATYTPPFPKWLERPGFWDESFFADIRLERLFTVLFVDERGRPLRLTSRVASWRPDRLEVEHLAGDLAIEESRAVVGGAWVSRFTLRGSGVLRAFIWSLQEMRADGVGAPWRSATSWACEGGRFRLGFSTRWPREVAPDRTAVEVEEVAAGGEALPGVEVHLALGARGAAKGWWARAAQRHDDSPRWETSILPELPSGSSVEFLRMDGLLHCVAEHELTAGRPLVVACGAGLTAEAADAALEGALSDDPIERSEESWRGYFASVPQFACSDPKITDAYWYRWYGLRLNTVDVPGLPIAGRGGVFRPYVTEGVGFFRNFITYSAQTHLREASWMHDPALCVGILDNLGLVQKSDGSFPGHNYSARPARDFYHADFATGAEQTDSIHPGTLRDEHLRTLRRYAEYFVRERTVGRGSAVLDQNETGQEYMNRYLFASARADEWESFRVAGVDASAYVRRLVGFLESRGEAVEGGPDCAWHWDDGAQYFVDKMPDGAHSPARPATGFYPLMLPELPVSAAKAVAMVRKWLLSPERFWLEKGFPAEAATEPTFSAEPRWKGVRMSCPWNGRSWPMVNSHLVDALANVARKCDPTLREHAAAALRKSLHLLFHPGEGGGPCCYEHYNPATGMPAVYRGYDDYMHSWVVDLIMRHAVGVLPGSGGEIPGDWGLDPLPLGEDVECSRIPHPEGMLSVRVRSGSPSHDLQRHNGRG